MATNITERLDYVLHIPLEFKKKLAAIWHFENLKIAYDGNDIWIKDLTLDQLDSREVKTLIDAKVYYVKDDKLFPRGNLLPISTFSLTTPWEPIQHSIKIEIPKVNHNFFGIDKLANFELARTDEVRQTVAQLINITPSNSQAIETAASYRLKNLVYTIINSNQLLIMGTPLLPLRGHGFWKSREMLFPNGYHFKYPALETVVLKALNSTGNHIIVWKQNHSYVLLPKEMFVPLTISSYRKSLKLLAHE